MNSPDMPTPRTITFTLELPVLDDGTAVQLYNALCDIVDQFDAHYGEQICRFYLAREALSQPTSRPHPNNPF